MTEKKYLISIVLTAKDLGVELPSTFRSWTIFIVNKLPSGSAVLQFLPYSMGWFHDYLLTKPSPLIDESKHFF